MKQWIVCLAAAAGLVTAGAASAAPGRPGAVYTLTNAAAANALSVFARQADGQLTFLYDVPTGGQGTGMGLGSQNALVASEDGDFLFAVDAGSDEVSVLAVLSDLVVQLVDTVPSGGDMPTSLAVHEGVLYVLNAGVPNTLAGFRIAAGGTLTPLAGSERGLSGADTAPAQIAFDPRGRWLVVTERMTSLIDVFPVGPTGYLSQPLLVDSAGTTPFGFAFRGGRRLIVSEAFGGDPDASAVSSYDLRRDGTVTPVSESVPTEETAACWVALGRGGRFAYTTNTGDGSITGFRVARDGALERLDADGKTALTGDGSGPIDLALTRDQRFLYALGGANGTIAGFAVRPRGALAPVEIETGLPVRSAGIVAR